MNTRLYKPLTYLAIGGNTIYALWILVNGIDEGFKATPVEIVSYVGLIILLLLNITLLYGKK